MIGAIDSAINRKAELVTLEVRISNYSAKKLYSKFGFNEVGIRKNYYFDNREDALIMTTNSILNSNYQEEFYKIYQTQLKIYKESSWSNISWLSMILADFTLESIWDFLLAPTITEETAGLDKVHAIVNDIGL